MKDTDYIGEIVKHKKYGTGRITSIDKTNVTVRFDGCDEDKLFSYPRSFEKYIAFENADKQAAVLEEIENQKKAREAAPKEIIKESNKAVLDIVRKGDSFRTHAEVLNECFGYDYGVYQPAFKKLDGGKYAVWFPNIAFLREGKYVSSDKTSGWVNVLSDQGRTLTQIDKDEQRAPDDWERLVFAKQENSDTYMFLGLFDKGKRVKDGVAFSLISADFDLKTMSPITEK